MQPKPLGRMCSIVCTFAQTRPYRCICIVCSLEQELEERINAVDLLRQEHALSSAQLVSAKVNMAVHSLCFQMLVVTHHCIVSLHIDTIVAVRKRLLAAEKRLRKFSGTLHLRWSPFSSSETPLRQHRQALLDDATAEVKLLQR